MALSGASHPRDLTDDQWVLIGPFLPELARRKDGRGRPWRENRAVLNGILWILRTGASWADLPDRYPSYQTCHRRFQQWVQSGVLKDIRARQEGRELCREDETRQGDEDYGDR